jgi:hypothetical protein
VQTTTVVQDEDFYLSFPDVALARDGHLVLVYRQADAHVAGESQLCLLHSDDGGASWGRRLDLDEPLSIDRDGGVWNCPRIVCQRDGGLTVICDASFVPAGRDSATGESERRFRTYIWRSFDGGRTWSARRSTPIQGLVPDRLLELSDDTWLIASHHESLRYFDTFRQIVTLTGVAGENWNLTVPIAEVRGLRFCEGSICHQPSGALVCFMRENSLRNIPVHRCYSSDGGLHWSLPHPCRFIGHRPVAGVLRSGRTLVTYRDATVADPTSAPRLPCHAATMAWVGDPFDEASGAVLTLERDQSAVLGDYGYSGWVQLRDDTIFCAYHHRGAARRSYIRGAWFREEEVSEPLPVTEAKLYY